MNKILNTIISLPFCASLMAMESQKIVLDLKEESEESAQQKSPIQLPTSPAIGPNIKALQQAANQSSATTIIRQAASRTVDFIVEHPVSVALAVGAVVAVPVGVYLATRPSFSFDNTQYQSFYKRTLSQYQRTTYQSTLLTIKNPLDLVDNEPFMQSLTGTQRVQLLLLFKEYIAQQRSVHVPEEEKKYHEDALCLSQHRCNAFERMLLEKLTLTEQNSHLIEGYNQYYGATDSPAKCITTIVLERAPTAFYCSTQDNLLFAAFDAEVIGIWHIPTRKCLALLPTQCTAPITHITVAPTGETLAAVSSSGEITLISLENQRVYRHWKDSTEGAFTTMGFDASGTVLVTGTAQGVIKLWNTKGELLQGALLSGLRMTKRSPILHASMYKQSEIYVLQQQHAFIWMPTSSVLLSEYNPTVKKTVLSTKALALLPQRNGCIIAEPDEIVVYALSGERQNTIPLRTITALAHCGDDCIAIVNSHDWIEVWDTTHGKLVCTFNGLTHNLKLTNQGPTEIVGIDASKEITLIRTWQLLGSQTRQSLASPYEEENPFQLLDNQEFMKTLASKELRTQFKMRLERYAHAYLLQALTAIFGPEPHSYKTRIEKDRRSIDPIIMTGELPQQLEAALKQLQSQLEDFARLQETYTALIKEKE